MQNSRQLFIGILIGLGIALLVAKQFFAKTTNQHTIQQVVPADQDDKAAKKPDPPLSDNSQRTKGIPQKVYDDLKYIRENNHAMPGYVGGRIFSNREEILPREDNSGRPILYHEWDVNEKIEGQNRGTERIITGSDGRAWYTNDHYQSFKEIK